MRETESRSASRRSRQERQPRAEREPDPLAVRKGFTKDDALAPGAALDQPGGDHDSANGHAVALAAREQAIDQQAQRALELLTRRRLGQVATTRWMSSPRDARPQRRIAPARKIMRALAGTAKAISDLRARHLCQSAERGDPEPLERRGELRRSRPQYGGAPTGSGAPGGLGRPARSRAALRARAATRRRARRSARARSADPRTGRAAARGASRRPHRRRSRRAAGAARARRSRRGRARSVRRPHRCPPARATSALPRVGADARRVGRDERERRAARQRLPQPHPGMDAERLGGRRHLADQRLARPGSGASAAGRAINASRPPAATASSKRGSRTADDWTRTYVRTIVK